jgi:hypothetical protein
MPLNPFFLQGSASEQRLVQDLINEQLKIYGVEVFYMPRKFVGTDNIIKENVVARFDDSFALEAYVQNYEGFAGSGDLMTKFGVRTTDELTLVISRERYDDFVSVFYEDGADETKLTSRPKEGDLIYFPLSDSLFEVKFVEHEQPFYQLGKLYMYQLTCELYEYEDAVIDTSIEEIDNNAEDDGFIATLTLAGVGQTAAFSAGLSTSGVNTITLINDGFGYTSPPAVAISTSPSGSTDANATAVAITTSAGAGSTTFSIKEVLITNPGFGYTIAPTVTFSGAGGSGAVARAGIGTNVAKILFSSAAGSKYTSPPVVSISTSPSGLSTANATGVAIVSAAGTITDIRLTNAGFGYASPPVITIANPNTGVGTGNFFLNEVVKGQSSLCTARVKDWDADTNILKISNIATNFALGEILVGSATTGEFPGMGQTGSYTISKISLDNFQDDEFANNLVIENEADGGLVDFTESNPFGSF